LTETRHVTRGGCLGLAGPQSLSPPSYYVLSCLCASPQSGGRAWGRAQEAWV
jgi:hypothetical protein